MVIFVILSHVVCEGRENVEDKGLGFLFWWGLLQCIIGYDPSGNYS